jgi:hypothetical protein
LGRPILRGLYIWNSLGFRLKVQRFRVQRLRVLGLTVQGSEVRGFRIDDC